MEKLATKVGIGLLNNSTLPEGTWKEAMQRRRWFVLPQNIEKYTQYIPEEVLLAHQRIAKEKNSTIIMYLPDGLETGINLVELEGMDFMSEMDMEISKTSFPYFFQNVLGLMFPPYMQEWLESMHKTDRTVIICSRDHGKIRIHAFMGSLESYLSRATISDAIHLIQPKADTCSHEGD